MKNRTGSRRKKTVRQSAEPPPNWERLEVLAERVLAKLSRIVETIALTPRDYDNARLDVNERSSAPGVETDALRAI